MPADEPVVLGDGAPHPADLGDPQRFDRAIAEIDRANAEDPGSMTHRGVTLPKELLHSRLMTAWLTRLDPDAGEAAHLAARAHHFRRWTRPRDAHPEGRAGYLRWRAAAKRDQAAEVGVLLGGLGYDDETVQRVGAIIRKEGLGSDPVVQTHEDALCLVFLTTQLDEVSEKVGPDQMVEILRRTLPKMSPAAIDAATTLDLGPNGADLLSRAVQEPGDRSAG